MIDLTKYGMEGSTEGAKISLLIHELGDHKSYYHSGNYIISYGGEANDGLFEETIDIPGEYVFVSTLKDLYKYVPNLDEVVAEKISPRLIIK